MDKDLPYIYCLTILLVILVALTNSGKCEDECQSTTCKYLLSHLPLAPFLSLLLAYASFLYVIIHCIAHNSKYIIVAITIIVVTVVELKSHRHYRPLYKKHWSCTVFQGIDCCLIIIYRAVCIKSYTRHKPCNK